MMDVITYAKTAKIGKFVGDTSTDLGTHTDTFITEYVNMSPRTSTAGNVGLTITKSHIEASGSCNATTIYKLQENISVPAGNYTFSIGSPINSAGYQIQLLDSGGNFIKAFTSTGGGHAYDFTLENADTLTLRILVNTGNTINDSNEISIIRTEIITGDNTLAYVAKRTEEIIGDFNTDLGTHENKEITEYINMTTGSSTAGNVGFTVTKSHVTATGVCNETKLKSLQTGISLPKGNYVFSIGTLIISNGFQLQVRDSGNNVIAIFSSTSPNFETSFTLASADTVALYAMVTNGKSIDESHEISIKKVVDETIKNTLAYLAQQTGTDFLTGKKILAFGDSIWGDDRTNGIANFLAEYTGATVYNAGIGGTRITGDRTQSEVPKFIPFDGVTLINAYLTKTWTEQDAGASEVWDYVSESTLPMLKSLDLQTIDIVILAYGTNDFTAPKSIADVSSAFLTAVSALLTAKPSLRILCILPPWRMFTSGTVDGDTYENGNGDTLQEFDAGIESAIKAKHTETLNMFERLPWRAETKLYYMDSDATHPGKYGNMVYAHVVNGKLRSMF